MSHHDEQPIASSPASTRVATISPRRAAARAARGPTGRLAPRASAVALAVATAATLLVVSPAAALESTDADRTSVGITVYNNDLGLVREVRRVKLPAGPSELRFMDVAAAIRPETVSVLADNGDATRVLEQNYEYDLLSPAKVLEKYVGRDVTVYVKNDETGEERPVAAKLLSVSGGQIFEIGEDISLGLPGRVVVPKLPDNLIARPTLVWHLESKKAGKRELEVSYLTRSMSWQADYVAALAPDEKTLELTGWVTVDNKSGAAYENARLKLVAGDVNIVRPEVRADHRRGVQVAMAMAAPKQFTERGFFEYHLYELERPTTLKQNQTKQIELLAASGVPVKKRFIAESTFQPYNPGGRPSDQPAEKAAVKLEVENTAEANLGRALPKGIVRVYKRDTDDTLTFAGEDSIDHTPDGETVRLTLGQAFDVLFERDVKSFREISKREVEAEIVVTVKNRKTEPVTVTVVERFARERRVLSSSIPPTEPDAFRLEFEVDVEPKSESALTYRVQARR